MGGLLTRGEAAERMGISAVTVDRLRKAGKLAYVQHVPNGKVWITEDAIAEYVAMATHPVQMVRPAITTYRKRRVSA